MKTAQHGGRPAATGAWLALLAAAVGGCSREPGPPAPASSPAPHRIVSLAPNITEIIYAVGADDLLVGNTRYCKFPPKARDVPKVGGYYDPSYERIVALRPELVILLPEHVEARQRLAELGIPWAEIRCEGLGGLLDAVTDIARICGRAAQGAGVTARMRAAIDEIRARPRRGPPPSAILCVGRGMGAGAVSEVYIAGPDTFHGTLLAAAGGTNAYSGRLRFPLLSQEGILRLNPDVILEFVADLAEQSVSEEDIKADWRRFPRVPAVATGRIHVFGGEHVAIPGPRCIDLLDAIQRALYPE